ncbi:predicted protein [Sclerotinia sclerotiorum 1980 UF-70]|uniref:Uncharacterized protein n=2 Tax=Sclerotinia sclerotiorum (strain ATCC 18683 / 1980 / Ss-1) TaxID=665079 RepID=A7EX36_SCLS1|nr:predicted protein [Sclerotinia sclerotiorum 1980 UF-70]APA05469.1 hypothetical protein sscle_01g002390 [Sclerotinia sclerotiorum 1980 UF-70]EDN94028.1 predicted protein [Sclerotinia sclerotiorum 1980 UF-70]
MTTNDNTNSTQQPSKARGVPSMTPQYSPNLAYSHQVPGASDQAGSPPSYEEAQRSSRQQSSKTRSVPSVNPQHSPSSAYSRQISGGSEQPNSPPSYEEAQRVWHNENHLSSDMNSTLSGAADVSDAEANRPLITNGFEGYTFTEPNGSDNTVDTSTAEANRPLITDEFKGYNLTEPTGSDNTRS